MLAGALASAALTPILGFSLFGIILGMAVGAAYSASLRPTRHAYVDNLMAGAALGIPLWGIISVVAIPLFSGEKPQWSAEQIREHFPALVCWVLYGGLLGLITQGLSDAAEKILGPEAEKQSTPQETRRIVILGGGFAGMRTAECLEKELSAPSRSPSSVIQMLSFSLRCWPRLPGAVWNPVTSALHCAAAFVELSLFVASPPA
jgi:hypothetical protein